MTKINKNETNFFTSPSEKISSLWEGDSYHTAQMIAAGFGLGLRLGLRCRHAGQQQPGEDDRDELVNRTVRARVAVRCFYS